jgi:hypothetical protein
LTRVDNEWEPSPVLSAVELTLDCANAERLAAFWKTAVGYVDEPPPAPFASRADWLAALGEPVGDRIGGAWLIHPSGLAPRLALLEVPEPKVAKNRLHMDLRVSGSGSSDARWERVTAEVQRLVAAGASVLTEFPWHHVVLADPEGNEFCVA